MKKEIEEAFEKQDHLHGVATAYEAGWEAACAYLQGKPPNFEIYNLTSHELSFNVTGNNQLMKIEVTKP